MAYQTNTSIAGHKALMGLLETFLSGQGWTINDNTNGAERLLYVSKTIDSEELFFEMESTGTDDIQLLAGTAHPVTADVSDTVYINLTTGTIAQSWFFVGDLYCHVIVEVAAGYFQMFGFGKVTPYYTFSASDKEGTFVYGCDQINWSTLKTSMSHDNFSLLRDNSACPATFRAVPDSGVDWLDPYYAIDDRTIGSSLNVLTLLARIPNDTGDRIMMPIRIPLVNTPDTADNDTFFFGAIPNMAAFPLANLVNKSEVTLGSDVWVKFPMPYFNNAVSPVTDGLGFAFKK